MRQLVLQVHSVLQAYIVVHDNVFSNSLRRILPVPWLFQCVNFEHLAIDLKVLEEDLETIQGEAQADAQQDALRDDLALTTSLINYIDILAATIKKLRSICIALHIKSEGQKYTWAEYRRDLRQYEDLVSQYREAGSELNRSMSGST